MVASPTGPTDPTWGAEQMFGAARPLWDALLEDLQQATRVQPAWRFYGRNYGWALAFKKGGRALAALFPDDARLTVLVVLSAGQSDAALPDPTVGQATRTLISSLPRFNEGCWVFLPVADGAELADVSGRRQHAPPGRGCREACLLP